MAYPAHLLTDDETVLREFHPHWRVLLLPLSWTALAIVGVVLAWGLSDDTTLSWVVTGVVVLGWLVLSAPPYLRWLFTQYVLTTERIIVRTGMIARKGTEIPLEEINHVRFSQNVVERVLGYGDVLLESAGQQGQNRLRDIPRPEDFQSEIYRAREARALHFESGGTTPRDAVAQLEALANLRDRGALTDEEYEQQKRRLLGSG